MTEQILSPEAMSDLRRRVYLKEQPSMEELRAAVYTLRQGRFAAAEVKSAKAKKAAKKNTPLDLNAVFDSGESSEPTE